MQTKMQTSSQLKNTTGRRLERARAFQVIYGLFFNQADSARSLGRLFARSLYAEPLEGSAYDAEFCLEDQEAGDENSPQRKPGQFVPNLQDLESGEENEHVVTPDAGEADAQPEGFAWELVLGVWSKRQELDKLVARFSQNWRLERMGRVELALLRLAVYELVFRDDVPPKVVINEAIELSRRFGDENSRSFVNGILDAAAKTVESGELKRGSLFWGG